MKIGIIYYSKTGNTRYVAHLLEQKLKEKNRDVDIVEIEAVKQPGFFGAGAAAIKEKELPIKNTGFDLKPYDTLIVGSPIWGGRPSPFLKTFFKCAKNVKGKKVACFVGGKGESGSHTLAQDIMRKNLEAVGMNVSDAFLDLQMGKGSIRSGEQEIEGFLDKVLPL